MSVRRSLSAAVLALLAVGASAAPGQASGPLVHARGGLTDLQPTATHVTDGASAHVSAWQTARGTTVVLHLRDLDTAHAGHTFGAHVHVGHCEAGQPAKAGAHYNITGDPTKASRATEVWLDFTVRSNGTAYAIARVPFTIPEHAAHSVVVHEHETDETDGTAGGRLACLPVHF